MNNDRFYETIRRHWPAEPPVTMSRQKADLFKARIKELLHQKNAVLIAHYYTDPEIQQLAEETGGFIGDSLEMARFGAEHSSTTVVIAGVRFMGESAKIISPHKRILMPNSAAECSLDLGCDPVAFKTFCAANPDRTVVVYANTSAEIKAIADWAVTSSIAVDVVKFLHDSGQKILWAPDRYLGGYIQRQTGADMLLWDAWCVVHAEFDADKILALKKMHPGAEILVHPESQPEVVAIADVVGSTSQLLQASKQRAARTFIVATEAGIFYKMQQASPEKEFLIAPSSSTNEAIACDGACPWMKMNNLENICAALENGSGEIILSAEIIAQAMKPLTRMLEFKRKS